MISINLKQNLGTPLDTSCHLLSLLDTSILSQERADDSMSPPIQEETDTSVVLVPALTDPLAQLVSIVVVQFQVVFQPFLLAIEAFFK